MVGDSPRSLFGFYKSSFHRLQALSFFVLFSASVALAPRIAASAKRHRLKQWSDGEGALIWMTQPFSVTALPFYHFKLSDERSGGAGAGVARQREKYSLIYQTNSSRHFSK